MTTKLKRLREQAEEAKTREQWAFDNQYEIYAERDLLVSVLARLWPSHVMSHTKAPDAPSRKRVICIHSPAGKLAWTIPTDLEPIYQRMATCGENDWDGCTIAEKRSRLRAFAESTHCVFPNDAKHYVK